MGNSRATIIISGDVQDVGFRGKVMRIAQKSKLLGYVENLPDGRVRVVCEGEEEVIHTFKKQLEIHEDDIKVDNIELKWSDATGEFKWFEVKYSDLGAEMFQGFTTAGRKLSEVGQKVDNVAGKVDGVSSDIKAMNTDMNTRFDTLDEKYGAISQQMNVLTKELQKSTQSLVTLTEKIGALIDHKLSE
jgi:acylphosphatase